MQNTHRALTLSFILSLAPVSALVLSSGCAATSTRQSTGQYVDDAAITAKIKTEFVRDEVVKAFDVKVDTFKGVVQLSGFVDSTAQKQRAETIAAGVAGVKSVQNNIAVK